MGSVSVLGINNFIRPEADYMKMEYKCPGLEHCYGLNVRNIAWW